MLSPDPESDSLTNHCAYIGGGMLATAKTESKVSLGEDMIVAGLFVQVIPFGFFIVVSVVFHRRMLVTPLHVAEPSIAWTLYIKVLYTASALIMVRSVYRVAEYVQGNTGYLQSHEAFIYVFDAALMILCCVLFNIFHPSKILSDSHKIVEQDDLEMMNNHGYRNFP